MNPYLFDMSQTLMLLSSELPVKEEEKHQIKMSKQVSEKGGNKAKGFKGGGDFENAPCFSHRITDYRHKSRKLLETFSRAN